MLATLSLTVLVSIGCTVDRDKFNRRVFACDVAARDPGCGTDEVGQLMGCFSARQIGATDFCSRRCDPTQVESDGNVCLASGIELQSCRPSDDDVGSACTQAGLSCYRTDLLSDEGVCTTLNPCVEDTDCKDPVRSVCATSFLSTTIYPESQGVLTLDHMFCLQTGCQANRTACSPGESCLRDVLPAEAHAADICVPNCDSQQRCPPNFLCYKKASTSVAPNVCIPGLLGFTCDSAIDCMVGKCVSTGIGYKVCTADCGSDTDCQKFDGEQGKFSCVKNNASPGEPGLCQTPDAYRGSICNTTEDCVMRNPAEVCTRFDPADSQGVCLLPCAEDQTCDQRGGINHTCIPVADGNGAVCLPGYFGYPCTSRDNCVGDLQCRPTFPGSPDSICTTPCTGDADCGKPAASGGPGDRWVGGDGFCGAPLSAICLPYGSLPDGSPCPSHAACTSGKCMDDHTCAPSPS